MNSHALIKVDTQQSWLERALGARGARLLLAMGGTAAVVLSIPAPLIEQVATSTGLTEISKFFAPPIGVGTRILLAGGLSLVPAAIVWALWGPRHVERSASTPADLEDDEYDYGSGPAIEHGQPDAQHEDQEIGDADEMMQAHKQTSSSGWGAIIRLVRGGFHDNGDGQDAALSRRRRDRHPDAPPRPPLFASRDLPPRDGAVAASDAFDAAPLCLSDAVAFMQPRPAAAIAPPPRSPDPMSDADIAHILSAVPASPAPLSEEEVSRVIATMPASKAVPATPAAPAPPVLARQVSATGPLSRNIELPLIEGADLTTLAARFERGLSKREVIVHADEAQHSLDARIALVQPDPSVRAALREKSPLEIVPTSVPMTERAPQEHASGPPLALDDDVELALSSALTTLRKLTEQGRR